MRYGFTTGSCAAAAAKAAAYMLLTGQKKERIRIVTPAGMVYEPEVIDIKRSEKSVTCAVVKDGGDDPDVTTGVRIYATAECGDGCGACMEDAKISIEGGRGVGRVTRPGLDQPVGHAAINRVPREMIRNEVLQVCRLCDYRRSIRIVIEVPEGERLAERTFNPHLGIEGGISILGTSGIVEPMSSKALLETIRVELRQKKACGSTVAIVSPGNYGLDFMRQAYDFDPDQSIKCSNFIGETIDMAVELGYEALLLTGHIGKLVKVAGGIMNTHSREADCRMELMVAAALVQEAPLSCLRQLMQCVTTEEAIGVLEAYKMREPVMQELLRRICYYLDKRAQGRLRIACILYSNEWGELAATQEASKLLREGK